jgi:hypothetical protein
VVADAEVVFRGRAELADPTGRIRRNVYQRSRGLQPATAADRVAAAERIAAEQAAAALERTVGEAAKDAADVRSCAVVVGAFGGAPLESILASHALAHAAEGRLYQEALLQGAEACGLEAVAVPKKSIWEQGESALGIAEDELRLRIEGLRKELGPPWAEDQKLAALAAWIALARSSRLRLLRDPAGAARSRRGKAPTGSG